MRIFKSTHIIPKQMKKFSRSSEFSSLKQMHSSQHRAMHLGPWRQVWLRQKNISSLLFCFFLVLPHGRQNYLSLGRKGRTRISEKTMGVRELCADRFQKEAYFFKLLSFSQHCLFHSFQATPFVAIINRDLLDPSTEVPQPVATVGRYN